MLYIQRSPEGQVHCMTHVNEIEYCIVLLGLLMSTQSDERDVSLPWKPGTVGSVLSLLNNHLIEGPDGSKSTCDLRVFKV